MQPETEKLKQLREDAEWARYHAEDSRRIAEAGYGEDSREFHHELQVRYLRLSSYAEELAALREGLTPLLKDACEDLGTLISFLQAYDASGALDYRMEVRTAGNRIQGTMSRLTALLAEGQPEPLKAMPEEPEAQ